MKYMTFNSSCSYAGVANMLEKFGIDVEDRQIALDMGLPFLFSVQDGVYLSGPMLQTAEWFSLYLQPKGFLMTETSLPREEVPGFLESNSPAMLGIANPPRGKHAVVYMGKEGGNFLFLNNKREETSEPDILSFSCEELMGRLDSNVMIAGLQKISPLAVDLKPYLQNSVNVLRQLKQDITAFCSRMQTPQALREAWDTLFRAILLDGITMLELLGNPEPKETLKSIRKDFLSALKENRPLVPAEKISMQKFGQAVDAYISLIENVRPDGKGVLFQL